MYLLKILLKIRALIYPARPNPMIRSKNAAAINCPKNKNAHGSRLMTANQDGKRQMCQRHEERILKYFLRAVLKKTP